MNKRYFLVIIIVLAIIAITIILNTPRQAEVKNTGTAAKDHRNISYIIEGQSVTLNDGLFEVSSASSSIARNITRYFGNEIRHDLDDNGLEDVVFLLTQDRGGSGNFFYVVAALNTPSGYIGSQAYFLGDRIAPQSINIDEGTTTQETRRQNVIIVNFATHAPDEPLVSQPTVGKSVWIKLNPAKMQFAEVAQNFEGERSN